MTAITRTCETSGVDSYCPSAAPPSYLSDHRSIGLHGEKPRTNRGRPALIRLANLADRTVDISAGHILTGGL
jgi:hypothetical protein